MLRKFKITIDGKEYLVEMEEIGGVPQPQPAQPVPSTAPAASIPDPEPVAAPVSAPAPASPSESAGEAMTAPMPGTILKILVNPGEQVQENQPLMILEAMKMENEIVAGKAGTVAGIHVATGDMVNPGEALITIS